MRAMSTRYIVKEGVAMREADLVCCREKAEVATAGSVFMGREMSAGVEASSSCC